MTDPKQDSRNGWNPPDQRRTGSAGGGTDRSCMTVAATALLGFLLVFVLGHIGLAVLLP